MTPDEVRLLDNKYAILFIRGERPVIDLKYDILKHPNVKYTTDGKEKPYIHGGEEKVEVPSVFEQIKEESRYKDFEELENIKEIEKISKNYEIYSDDEVKEMIFEGGF